MKKENGFTLIELLAVILILGIIALIAIPTVNKIINQANQEAAEASALNIITAAENKYAYNLLTGEVLSHVDVTKDKLNYSGEKPLKGMVYFDEKGNPNATIYISNYCVTYDNGNVNSERLEVDECKIKLPMPAPGLYETGALIKYQNGEDITDMLITAWEDESPYYFRKQVGDVVLPKTITTINSHEYQMSSFTGIFIPDSVVTIGNHSFQKCTNLETVIMKGGTFDSHIFSTCDKLKNITIGEKVISIGNHSFYKCPNIETVVFEDPNGWTVSPGDKAVDVSDKVEAANLVKNKYCYYTWEHNIN